MYVDLTLEVALVLACEHCVEFSKDTLWPNLKTIYALKYQKCFLNLQSLLNNHPKSTTPQLCHQVPNIIYISNAKRLNSKFLCSAMCALNGCGRQESGNDFLRRSIFYW